MDGLISYLSNSYTAWQAVENAAALLEQHGFCRLHENKTWSLKEGGKYFVIRNGASIVAFVNGAGNGFKIVASHTDSPCFKLKENPAVGDDKFTRLNTEPYGGGLYYTFFDRPLKLAGRVVEGKGTLKARSFVSDFQVVLPSLAIHQNRDANDKFAPNPQTELPLLSLGKKDFDALIGSPLSYDLFAVPAETPFTSGADGEFLSSPRLDNLTSVYSSLQALMGKTQGVCVCACLNSEEVGSRTREGAAGDFLSAVLERIALSRSMTRDEYLAALSTSLLVSLDNAHSMHPNHPEKCDPTNRAVMGGGVVIKSHAGGAYTTDALTSAAIKRIFEGAGVKYQAYYNRSDMRSGSTLGAISLGQVCVPSVDLGLAQLAMHSAVETVAKSDIAELEKGLAAFFDSKIKIDGDSVEIK